ncbi:MAG: hypothetical protein MI740_08175 [Halanaerobiales bacterium]|nr:hypothetical protein [Halanaerobiales bacterium]
MKLIELWMIDQKIREKSRELAQQQAKDIEEENKLADSYHYRFYNKIFDMLHFGEIKPY